MIGNYFMLATIDSDGVLNHTFRDISDALSNGCLVVVTGDSSGVIGYSLISTIDRENLALEFGSLSFTAEDIDAFPVIDT